MNKLRFLPFILIPLTIIVGLVALSFPRSGEVESWAFGVPHQKNCPLWGSYPRRWSADLKPAHIHYHTQIKQAFKFWNDLSLAEGYPKLFVEVREGEGADIKVLAGPKEQRAGSFCEDFQVDKVGHIANPENIAWVGFKETGADVFICFDQYARYTALPKADPVVRRNGIETYIKHEIGHLLIGMRHPTGASLMAPSAKGPDLAKITRSIILKHVLQKCWSGRRGGL